MKEAIKELESLRNQLLPLLKQSEFHFYAANLIDRVDDIKSLLEQPASNNLFSSGDTCGNPNRVIPTTMTFDRMGDKPQDIAMAVLQEMANGQGFENQWVQKAIKTVTESK